jgi:hypothetical protein
MKFRSILISVLLATFTYSQGFDEDSSEFDARDEAQFTRHESQFTRDESQFVCPQICCEGSMKPCLRLGCRPNCYEESDTLDEPKVRITELTSSDLFADMFDDESIRTFGIGDESLSSIRKSIFSGDSKIENEEDQKHDPLNTEKIGSVDDYYTNLGNTQDSLYIDKDQEDDSIDLTDAMSGITSEDFSLLSGIFSNNFFQDIENSTK